MMGVLKSIGIVLGAFLGITGLLFATKGFEMLFAELFSLEDSGLTMYLGFVATVVATGAAAIIIANTNRY